MTFLDYNRTEQRLTFKSEKSITYLDNITAF